MGVAKTCLQRSPRLPKRVGSRWIANLFLKLMFLSLHETSLPINTNKLHSWGLVTKCSGCFQGRVALNTADICKCHEGIASKRWRLWANICPQYMDNVGQCISPRRYGECGPVHDSDTSSGPHRMAPTRRTYCRLWPYPLGVA